MPQVPMYLPDAADLYNPQIQRMWINRASKTVQNYDKVCNIETGVTDFELRESDISGLSLAGRVTENLAVVGESPVQGFDAVFTQVEYGLLMAFTKRMWQFGIKKRKLESIVNELNESCVKKREQLVFNRINNAQAASYTENDSNGNFTVTATNANGVRLASNAQTREDGGTNNNNVIYNGTNYNPTASYDMLKALERTADRVLDPKGNKAYISPTRLVVRRGGSAKFKLLEILGAIRNDKLPETFSNDASGVTAKYEVITTPYLDSATQVHAIDANMLGMNSGLQYKESQPITLEPMNLVYKTGEMQRKITMQFANGVKDYRGHFDTNATGS